MVCIERHRNTQTERLPGRAFAHEAVRDVTERAVRSAESSADEVGQLPADRSLRVVHADEPPNFLVAVLVVDHPLHATGQRPGNGSSREPRTWIAPPSPSSAVESWPLAPPTEIAPAALAAAVSRAASPTAWTSSGVRGA